MNLENFAEYLKYPSRLYQLPYEELKSLTLQYPYCANFHMLLLIKSKLEGHPDLEKNLARAATYSVDRSFLRRLMQEQQLLPVDSQITVGEDEILELKDLFSLDSELEKVPLSDELPSQETPLAYSLSLNGSDNDDLLVPLEEEIVIGENSDEDVLPETPAESFSDVDLEPHPEVAPVPEDVVDVADERVPDAAAEIQPPFFAPEEIILQAGSSIQISHYLSVRPAESKVEVVLPSTVSLPDEVIPDCVAASLSLDSYWEQQSRREVTEWEWEILPVPHTTGQEVEALIEPAHAPGPAPIPKSSFKSFQKRYHRQSSNQDVIPPPLPEDPPEVVSPTNPKEIAAESLRVDLGIASETLAGLLVRQHQYDRAIQMYEHLSLLIPEKNAYFAAKIDAIKNL
ncbi:MAG: hypothetical protein R2824_23305 [Saprospiraceae bacterium]